MSDNPDFQVKTGHSLDMLTFQFSPAAPGAVLILRIGQLPSLTRVLIRSDVDTKSEMTWDGEYGSIHLKTSTVDLLDEGMSDYLISVVPSEETAEDTAAGKIEKIRTMP